MSKSLQSLTQEIDTNQKIKEYKAVSKGIANFDTKILNHSLIQSINFIAFNVNDKELTFINDNFEGSNEPDTIIIKNYKNIQSFSDIKRFTSIKGDQIVQVIKSLSSDNSKYDMNINDSSTVGKVIFEITEHIDENENTEEETNNENDN